MRTPTRLAAFAAGLVVLFGGAYATAALVVPDSTADAFAEQSDGHGHGAGQGDRSESDEHSDAAHAVGLSVSQNGYLLDGLSAPDEVADPGRLDFRLLDPDGAAVTDFETVHAEELHLIVVRTDGTGFRHVHPERDAEGVWSIGWQWEAAGTYRVYVDATPAGADALVLGATLEVAGDVEPVVPEPTRDAVVNGYEVFLAGNLLAGGTSELTAQVRRDGEPVTTLEPYLGAYGHLVALRASDQAYLHVHPQGAEPAAGETSGPDIAFEAHVSTPGRYLLYLDFQVDGEVRTAAFVIDAVPAGGGGHEGTDEGTGEGTGGGHDHEH